MDFALKYALKEIKKRPLEFLPILLTSFGVLILLFNLIIYNESRRVTDIAYYKLDFEIKLYEMPKESIARVEALEYVKKVKAAEKKGAADSYTLYIELTPQYNKDVFKIYAAFDKLIADINLWRYPYYEEAGYKEYYEEFGIKDMMFDQWFNERYIQALIYDPVISPAMLTIISAGAVLMAAVMTLVFSLKLKKSISEYAMLRALGMTSFDIMKINMFQGIGIMLLCVPPAFAASAGVMKAVCEASQNLFPELKDNTALTYIVPVKYMFTAALVLALVSGIALILAVRMYNKKTVVELINGAGQIKISFVEKSSDKFERAEDFSYYGRIYGKRTRKSNVTTNILYVGMMIFPLIFAFQIFYTLNFLFEELPKLDSTTVPVYLISPNKTQGVDRTGIPKDIYDELLTIDGAIMKKRSPESAYSYYTIAENDNSYSGGTQILDRGRYKSDSVDLCEYGGDVSDEYGGFDSKNVYAAYQLTEDKVIHGSLDGLKETGAVAVFECLGYAVGEEVIIEHGEYSMKATVAAVLKDDEIVIHTYNMMDLETNEPYLATYSNAFCSLETLKELFGIEETVYTQMIHIYAEKGREEEVIEEVEFIAGTNNSYDSEYEQRQYSSGLIGTNYYIMNKKNVTVTLFESFFTGAQIIFLFVSSALIISSINSFNINRRRREFAVIRALGEMRVNIINTVKRGAVINAVIVAATATAAAFVCIMVIMPPPYPNSTFIRQLMYVLNYAVRSYYTYIFMFAFMIGVNLLSSLKAVKKATGDNLIDDIRKF